MARVAGPGAGSCRRSPVRRDLGIARDPVVPARPGAATASGHQRLVGVQHDVVSLVRDGLEPSDRSIPEGSDPGAAGPGRCAPPGSRDRTTPRRPPQRSVTPASARGCTEVTLQRVRMRSRNGATSFSTYRAEPPRTTRQGSDGFASNSPWLSKKRTKVVAGMLQEGHGDRPTRWPHPSGSRSGRRTRPSSRRSAEVVAQRRLLARRAPAGGRDSRLNRSTSRSMRRKEGRSRLDGWAKIPRIPRLPTRDPCARSSGRSSCRWAGSARPSSSSSRVKWG